MIKRIIFIIQSPFCLRDYKRFGIELLQRNGFEVEVWDTGSALLPDVFSKYIPPKRFYYNGLKIFNDKMKLYNRLAELKNKDFVVNLINYNFNFLTFYKILSRSKANYAISIINSLPRYGDSTEDRKLNVYFKKFKKLFPPTPQKFFRIVFPRLPLRLFGIKPARLIFAGGERPLLYHHHHYRRDAYAEVLWGHALDYDLYLNEKEPSSESTNTAIFLDAGGHQHPDDIFSGQKPLVSQDKYFFSLNNFFKLVEDQLGLEVIIAPHPKVNYKVDYFQGRRKISGQTASLIKESKLVLSHGSTATSLANLFYKPMIFLTSSEMDKRKDVADAIRTMANWFDKKPIFIDGDLNIDWKFELTVSKRHYESYRKAYIKTDHSEDLPFWQIVINRLRKGF
jgi:hypothetical protein